MRIVFCEDEPIIRKLIGLALRGTGHEFRLTADGGEALELVRSWRPDVLVTDVAMAGMDGRQLAAAVRADPELGDLRIVFMTASVQREAVEAEEDARGSRIAGHLRKPFGPGALRSLLVSLEQRDGGQGEPDR
jgi:two-component system cell cycle sensor histidine kinase/response regulator CckA